MASVKGNLMPTCILLSPASIKLFPILQRFRYGDDDDVRFISGGRYSERVEHVAEDLPQLDGIMSVIWLPSIIIKECQIDFGQPLALLLIIACANFLKNNIVVLTAQAYVAAFHAGASCCGAVFCHLILGHHPVTGFAPAVFIVMAYIVMYLRTNVLVATLITAVCVAVAAGLS